MTAFVTGLAHVNLRAPRELLERLRAFYRDVLGLRDGLRPPFLNAGFWLYAGDVAVVHLTLQPPEETPRVHTGVGVPHTVDHFAFSAVDPEVAAAALRAHGVAFEVTRSAATRQHQFFFADPAGNGVELNFPFHDEDTGAC
jgi:catechol 2,3-dioxygenase-like lactoylglutathione lyase family enzyme